MNEFPVELRDAIVSASNTALLGNMKPTGDWGIDGMIGASIAKQVIAYDQDHKNHGGYYVAMLLREVGEKCDCWKGVRAGIYDTLADVLSQAKGITLKVAA